MSPGTNAGTGQPVSFQCSQCRKRKGPPSIRALGADDKGRVSRIELTGRVRIGFYRKLRTGKDAYQYRCRDCGHVGWSKHVDLRSFAEHVANKTSRTPI